MQTVTGGSVAETYLIDVPGLSDADFALLRRSAQAVMDRYGHTSPVRPADVIDETRVLRGSLRVVMGAREAYGKCPEGDHWAGVVHTAAS